jgi:hypothetical protein
MRMRLIRTCVLLSVGCAATAWPRAARAEPRVQVTTELSGYADSDHVEVLTPALAVRAADDTEGWAVDGRYLVDVISAASVDIVATASQPWHEQRHAGALGGSYRARDATVGVQALVSSEPDYLSLGATGSLALRLDEDNVLPRLELSYVRDSVGRARQPNWLFRDNEKLGAQLGSTFVIDRASIVDVSLDLVLERGYLAKPYRYVPMFAAGTTLPAGAGVDAVNAARSPERPSEALPDARDRLALSARAAHRFERFTLRADQRAYMDSWGLLASTTDARVILNLHERLAVWPRVRFHAQNGASFWKRVYHAGPFLPQYRAGDRELSPLATWTVGVGTDVGLSGPLPHSELREPGAIALGFEIDFAETRYFDALYISRRRSLFSMLVLNQTW